MTEDTSIRPFQVHVPEPELEDLRRRLRNTRWPAESPEPGWTRGVPLEYLRALVGYWADGFDWRAQEQRLNEIPQFMTTIDGQDIHFLHVRSTEPHATPLLLTHGWPSSPFEFVNLIGPLADPRGHGRDPADAFHLIAPSLPGYGFSTPVADAGWGNLFRVAQAWATLMTRLGYERYAVQGTDVGAGVAGLLGMVDGARLQGVHLTGTAPAMPFGPPIDPTPLAGPDRDRAERFNQFQAEGLGYLHLQSTRPQTLAYSLTDSPVGQLAWIAEKFHEWTDPAASSPDEAVGRDALLTTVSVAWFTKAGGSSAHGTYEGMKIYREMAAQQDHDGWDEDAAAGPPTGVAVFAGDHTIKAVLDPAGRIEHWSEFDSGGHFPAMEAADLLADDIAAFFRPLR